jgi:outer membrane protein OmpA-like peptidoglycan-associated protein
MLEPMNCRSYIAALISLVSAHALIGQNLVPNPSFEEYYQVPFSFNDAAEKFKLPGWNSASRGTPDYFHAASSGDASVPLNWAGVSEAHSGMGYAGIFVGGKPGKDNGKVYREYIECKLLEPLQQDSLYVLEFYFKLSSYSHYTIDRVGMLLLDSAVKLKHNQAMNASPTLSIIRSSMQTGDWESARMVYKAHGGESYVIIGNFYDDYQTEKLKLEVKSGEGNMLRGIAYFYIDDVTVKPLEKQPKVEAKVVLPESGEIRANNAYLLSKIQFEFDSYVLLPSSFPELSKMVRVMQKNPSWKLEINGHADDQGTDEYNLQLSVNRAKGVADFLVSQGINPFRITIKGYGNKIPLRQGKDEVTRAINRRVEIEFMD